MQIKRMPNNPIIVPNMDSRMGDNINGPSLIRVPDWVENPLGKYYLYFAHHNGQYIRLAYADELTGPWTMYEPGVLALEDSFFDRHVASPDVIVDEDKQRIRMYYHGPTENGQKTRVALSGDGLDFEALPEILGHYYFRVWEYDGWTYALARDGFTFRSRDPLHGFEAGPQLFNKLFRHTAVRLDGDTLWVFYSDIADEPESIKVCTIDLKPDWTDWNPTAATVVLQPEESWEGADLPLQPSKQGWAPEPMNEVRDPGLYEENGRWYLLYSVAGEHGLAIAEITEW